MHVLSRSLVGVVIVVFVLLFSVSAFSSGPPYRQPGQDVLKSASELEYPPFALVLSDGSADGFSVELLRAVTRAVGMPIEFEVGPWHILKDKLIRGQLDVLPLVSYSKDRDKVLDFTAPYMKLQGTVFIRSNDTSIRTFQDLKDKEVMVMNGDNSHEYALENHLASNLILTETYEEAMILLSSGKHDAVLMLQVVGFQLLKHLNINNVISIHSQSEFNVRPVARPLSGYEQKFCFAVPEGRKELLARLNEGLAVVIANGVYNRVYDKWFGPILPRPGVSGVELVQYLVVILIPLLLLAAGAGLFYLKREVSKKTSHLEEEIKERKLTEAALRRSETRFQLAMAATRDGLFDWDLATNDVYYSPGWKRMLGYGDDELPNLPSVWEELIHPEDRARAQIVERELSAKRLDRGEMEIKMKHRDGHWVDILVRANVIFDHKDTAVRMVGTHVDISLRKSLEKQLLQSQKLESVGKLAGGIAHEFNNILAIIIGSNELVMEELPMASPVRHNAEDIHVAGLRARDIVKQLLTFSRQDHSEKHPRDIGAIVTESVKLLRVATPTNIEIETRISPRCSPVICNATQMNQILFNLCRNAADSLSLAGGWIRIELEEARIRNHHTPPAPGLCSGRYVRLRVCDNGCGMEKKIQDRIFDPYFTTKEVSKGCGIGLAVVHGIIQNHGGAILCESHPGRGTTFTIYLPAHGGEISPENRSAKALPGGNERILYVDDEPTITRLAEKTLGQLGYGITGTNDPLEALAWIQADPNRFDLVVTDMAMPGMPGDQLIETLLSIRPDLPTIICTGYSERISETRALELGARAFFMKPFKMGDLVVRIREILDGEKRAEPLSG